MDACYLRGREGTDVNKKRYSVYASAVLLLWAAVILSLAGGCAAHTNTNAAATASPTKAPSEPDGASATMGPFQSNSETDMVQFFHFLLRMDDGTRTAISKKQAEAVLPIVRRNVEEGNMKEKDKQAILDVFRTEQKSFYSRWKAQESNNPPPDSRADEWTETDKQKWKDEWMKPPGADGDKANPTGPENSSPPQHPGHPGQDDWAAGEKNVEQLLIERLEGKLKI